MLSTGYSYKKGIPSYSINVSEYLLCARDTWSIKPSLGLWEVWEDRVVSILFQYKNKQAHTHVNNSE